MLSRILPLNLNPLMQQANTKIKEKKKKKTKGQHTENIKIYTIGQFILSLLLLVVNMKLIPKRAIMIRAFSFSK